MLTDISSFDKTVPKIKGLAAIVNSQEETSADTKNNPYMVLSPGKTLPLQKKKNHRKYGSIKKPTSIQAIESGKKSYMTPMHSPAKHKLPDLYLADGDSSKKLQMSLPP